MKLICVFNFKEMSLWLGNSGHRFSLLSSPVSLLSTPYQHQGGSLESSQGNHFNLPFSLHYWWYSIRNIFFLEVDICKDHFQRDTSKSGYVSGILERMCFFFYYHYLLTFYSGTVMEDRQNNSHPVINYGWKTINSYSMFLSCSGKEGCIDYL